jgi:hypothetical protein
MGVEGLPGDAEEALDQLGRTGALQLNTALGDIKLRSSQEIELQPSGTPFGVRLKKEDDGSITPTLLFDSKKIREKRKPLNAEDIVNKALEEFNEAS